MKLSTIKSRKPHEVIHIEESDFKHRLYEMGIYPSQNLRLVQRAPLGDPIVIEVNDQSVMLRVSEAELISVQEN